MALKVQARRQKSGQSFICSRTHDVLIEIAHSSTNVGSYMICCGECCLLGVLCYRLPKCYRGAFSLKLTAEYGIVQVRQFAAMLQPNIVQLDQIATTLQPNRV